MLFVHDMIHNNPGLAQYDTAFREPEHLKSRGYTGKTFDLMNSAQLALTWELLDAKNPNREPVFPAGSDDRLWAEKKRKELKPLYEAASAAGLGVAFMMDVIVLPKRVVSLYPEILDSNGKIDIMAPKSKEILDCLFNELFQVFPELTGIYIRFGETYIGPKFGAPYHVGNHPILCDEDTYHQFLMNYLRDKVCVEHGRDIYYRTWSFSSFQYNPDAYLKFSRTVEPHEHFFFCIKHTVGDFHRTFPFNPCINIGEHQQVVEVQLSREYEGKGAYPNYIVDGVINGFEENRNTMLPLLTQNLRDILRDPNRKVAGVWTWSRGGGFGGPYITGKNDLDGYITVPNGKEIWPDVNAYVLAHWCQDPTHSDKHYAVEYAREILGYGSKDAELFYEILRRSAHAVLLGRGCNTECYRWDVFWTRDQNIEYARLFKNILYAAGSNNLELLLSERKRSVLEWKTILTFAYELADSNPNTAYIRTTCQYGFLLYSLYETMYRANIYAYLGNHADEVSTTVKEYDELWQQWQTLYQQAEGCPTLFEKENAFVDLIRYSWNKGFDSAIDPIRVLDANGHILPANRVQIGEDLGWGLSGEVFE